ncbi:MAG: hypothetical protein QOG55_3040 [Acidobacteriaceae bacterium]|jgi:hypothetical protein|nr:hypothetical protein [Acidobacteriaceae bacterium]
MIRRIGVRKKRSGWICYPSRSSVLDKKQAAPKSRCGWLEAEAGSQSDDAATKSSGNCAEIGVASVIGDLVGVKVEIIQ